MKITLIIFILFISGCASKTIDPAELSDYLPYSVSENNTTITGKYVECIMENKATMIGNIRTFHIGNGKISRVRSSWGNAEAGKTNYARWRTIDLISEDEGWLKIGDSNREYAKQCGAPLIPLEETVFNIRRFDGWISERFYTANNRTYGSNSDGFLTSRKFEEGECKLFKEEIRFGACKISDADPDVATFMKPYIPKGL